MKPHSTIVTAAGFSLFAAIAPAAGQDGRVEAARAAALRLRPDTLATFINDLAGLRVRLIRGVVDEIVSPRVFTLRNERPTRYPFQPNRVAIVVEAGSVVVRKGAPLVVTGMARTLIGAEQDSLRPLPSLNEKERQVVAKFPIVMASSVQAPEGVQLVRTKP